MSIPYHYSRYNFSYKNIYFIQMKRLCIDHRSCVEKKTIMYNVI